MQPSTTDELEQAVQSACQNNDYPRAATLILSELGPDLLRVIHARFMDEEQSGEVFARFAEDMWRGLPSFAFRCSLRAWLFTLARNAGSRYLKRDVKRQRAQVPLSNVPELQDQVARVRTATFAQSTNREDRLEQLRSELPEEDRLILMLRVDRQLDFREIALVTLGDAEADEAAVTREAARLRKRFQLVKERLKKRWQEQT